MARSASLRRFGRRLLALGGAGLLLGAAAGCDEGSGATAEQVDGRLVDVLPRAAPAREEAVPSDRAGMLRVLAPLPTEALLVVYRVEGPGGIAGSLEVLARPGGYRRENWTIHVPVGDPQKRRLAGSTIQTPDAVWIEGQPGTMRSVAVLGALADAALARPDHERRAIVERLRLRRATLAQARTEAAPRSEQILGVDCHVTRVSTIEMCLWEDTGLPLRYSSDGLRLEAVNIDQDASIGEHAFDLPAGSRGRLPEGFDPDQALRRLIEGDLGELSPYLHPGLRLPTAV